MKIGIDRYYNRILTNTSIEITYAMVCLSVLSPGKTVWNAKYTAWYGERRLSKSTGGDMTVDMATDIDTYDNIAIDDTPTDADSDADTDTDGVFRGDMSDSVHRRLFYSHISTCILTKPSLSIPCRILGVPYSLARR